MSPLEVQVRRDICQGCASPCPEHQAGQIAHADPCAECPRREWHAHGDCAEGAEPPAEAAGIGLGDAVAAVAQPIARAVDALTGGGTHLATCGGCKARQARWNRFRLGSRKP